VEKQRLALPHSPLRTRNLDDPRAVSRDGKQACCCASSDLSKSFYASHIAKSFFPANNEFASLHF
jgi:hypothetical protein